MGFFVLYWSHIMKKQRTQITDWANPSEHMPDTQWGAINYYEWCFNMGARMKRTTRIVTGTTGKVALFAL